MSWIETSASAAKDKLYRSIPSVMAASTTRKVILYAARGASKQVNVVKMCIVLEMATVEHRLEEEAHEASITVWNALGGESCNFGLHGYYRMSASLPWEACVIHKEPKFTIMHIRSTALLIDLHQPFCTTQGPR
jgi:hypothetical protein